ncbi:MAG: hypothetical protein H6891_05390 [Brucellaceae bacterium]|nr:hypothetical protein [Brucellaceae bacterium]
MTAILGTLLETIGGEPASTGLARALPSATREWLLQWSAARLCPDTRWFEARCSHCGEPFDLSIDLSHPVCRAASKPAAEVRASRPPSAPGASPCRPARTRSARPGCRRAGPEAHLRRALRTVRNRR